MKQMGILFFRVVLCFRKIALVRDVRVSLDGGEMGTGG